MKIAIISDIHENWHNLFLTLDKIEKLKCKQILCLGDMINTGIAITLNKQKIPVFGVWGNNDGDFTQILKKTVGNGSLTMSVANYGFFDIDNRKIFMSHFEDLAPSMAKSGDYDLVCFGHTHKTLVKKVNECFVVNPGEIAAVSKDKKTTFAVYDTKSNEVEIVEIENGVSFRTNYVEKMYEKYGFTK